MGGTHETFSGFHRSSEGEKAQKRPCSSNSGRSANPNQDLIKGREGKERQVQRKTEVTPRSKLREGRSLYRPNEKKGPERSGKGRAPAEAMA